MQQYTQDAVIYVVVILYGDCCAAKDVHVFMLITEINDEDSGCISYFHTIT